MPNLKEQRQIEKHAKDDDRSIVSIRLETFTDMLNAFETAAKYRKAKLIVYGDKSTPEDFDHMICLEIELFKLLEDVEVGDE